MLNDGVDDIPLNAVFRISSVIISCLALFYGLSKIYLINMTTSEPGTCSSIKLFFYRTSENNSFVFKSINMLKFVLC